MGNTTAQAICASALLGKAQGRHPPPIGGRPPLPTELLELDRVCCFETLFLFPKTLKSDVWGVLLVSCCCFAHRYLKDQRFPVSLDIHLRSCSNLYFTFTSRMVRVLLILYFFLAAFIRKRKKGPAPKNGVFVVLADPYRVALTKL